MPSSARQHHSSKPAHTSTVSPASNAPQASPGAAFAAQSQELTPSQILHMQRMSGNQAALSAVGGAPPRIAQPPIPMRPSTLYQSTMAPAAPSPAAGSAAAEAAAASPASPVAAASEAPAAAADPAPSAPSPAAPASPAAEPGAADPLANMPAGATDAAAPASAAPAAASAASPASAAPGGGGAAIPTPQIPADLQGKGHYKGVYDWFKEKAADDKKTALFGYFDALTPEQKIAAIDIMSGGGKSSNTLVNVKKKMISGIIFKSFDWDKFSAACREAKKIDTTNYNADTDRDYASYAAIGASSSVGGVSGSATISQALGAAGAKGTALGAAPVAGVLGGAAAISQVYNATQNYDESLSTTGKTQQVVGEGLGGAADLARVSAGTVNSVRLLGGMAANGAATAAAGAAGIVGGAAYMVSGAAGYLEGRRNARQLGEVEGRLAAGEQNELTKQQLLAAGLGRSTQEMNKSKSGMTALKGAAMVAGGALMIAAAASPAGPILIALGAILGGVAAIAKFYKKYKRKEAFVDKALKVDEAAALPENKGIERSKIRQALLEKNGFNNVGQCYSQLVTDLAGMLYDSGVKGDDKESMQIIENIGLKIDKTKQKPNKELIAKKLHT